MYFQLDSFSCPFSTKRKSLALSSVADLEYIAVGKSGIVRAIDDKRVVKIYDNDTEGSVERQAYKRLGSHPHIAKCFGTTKDGSIILERGIVLRKVCQNLGEITLHRKLRWLKQAAEGLQHVHDCNIVQADVSLNNMILTRNGCVKIIDFEGSSIDGEEPTSRYEWFSYRPSTPMISRKTDIFAYGCVMYEIISGKQPHQEIVELENRTSLSERLYEQDDFPDVTNLPLSEVIQACWHGDLNSMGEVVQAIEAVETSRKRLISTLLHRRMTCLSFS